MPRPPPRMELLGAPDRVILAAPPSGTQAEQMAPEAFTFSQMMQLLHEQHDAEVKALQATIKDLQMSVEQHRQQSGVLQGFVDESQHAFAEGWSMPEVECSKSECLADAAQSRGAHTASAERLGDDTEQDCSQQVAQRSCQSAFDEVPPHAKAAPNPLPAECVERDVASAQPCLLETSEPCGQVSIDQMPMDTGFDTWIGITILCNVIVMFLRLEYKGQMKGAELGLAKGEYNPAMEAFLDTSQHIFCVLCSLEVVLKVSLLRSVYFYAHGRIEWFNVLDAVLVISSAFELYLLDHIVGRSGNTDLTAARTLRIVRIFRLTRVLHSVEFLSPLKTLVATVVAAFMALFWSMVLLGVAIIAFAMLMCQLIHPYLRDDAVDDDLKAWLYMEYGTASRSVWTVFEMTFAGSWPNHVRPLVEHVNLIFAFICGLFITMIVFALTRIVTALFLKETLAVCARDAQLMITEKLAEKRRFANKLLDFFIEADTSQDGFVSREEFEQLLRNPMMKAFLSTLELDPSETGTLFDMLDDGDGKISQEEFVEGAMRLKGTARSQDVIPIMHVLKQLQQDIYDFGAAVAPSHNWPSGRRLTRKKTWTRVAVNNMRHDAEGGGAYESLPSGCLVEDHGHHDEEWR